MKDDDRTPLLHVRAGWIEDARTALCLVAAVAVIAALAVPFVDDATGDWLQPASWLVLGCDGLAFVALFVALGFGLIGTPPPAAKPVPPNWR